MTRLNHLIWGRFKDFKKVRIPCLVLICCMCAGCKPVESLTNPPVEPATTEIPSPTQTVDLALIQAQMDWEAGPHSAGYDLGKGPNTYCARCHSPLNWDQAARIDPPPNCVSCKFVSEETPRIAEGNPLINEAEWKGIECKVCHRQENGVTTAAIAWFDTPTGYYQTVSTPDQLCEKCHTDTKTLKHQKHFGDGAHQDYPCIDCHQPHTAAASCNAEGCHTEIAFTQEQNPEYAGHTLYHQSVECVACHDASGLEVGPLKDQEIWTTYRTTELLGRSQTGPYVSHTISRDVSCERCHFVENPWKLVETVTP